MFPIGKEIQIQNANNWELAYTVVKGADVVNQSELILNQRYIYPFDIPVLIESNIIAIAANSANASNNWYTAGFLTNSSQFPNSTTTIGDDFPLSVATIETKRIALNKGFQIEFFNTSTPELRLTFNPRPWLNNIGLAIYAYTGPITDDVLEELGATRIKLELIDSKLDQIIGTP